MPTKVTLLDLLFAVQANSKAALGISWNVGCSDGFINLILHFIKGAYSSQSRQRACYLEYWNFIQVGDFTTIVSTVALLVLFSLKDDKTLLIPA